MYLKDNRQRPEGEVGMPVMMGVEQTVGMVVKLEVEEEAVGMVVMLKVDGPVVGMFVKDSRREDMSGDSQPEVEREGKRMVMVDRLYKEMMQSKWWREGKENQSRRWRLPAGMEPLPLMVEVQYRMSKPE